MLFTSGNQEQLLTHLHDGMGSGHAPILEEQASLQVTEQGGQTQGSTRQQKDHQELLQEQMREEDLK